MKTNIFLKNLLSISIWGVILSGITQAQIKVNNVFANQLIIIGNISAGEAMNTVGMISGSTIKNETHKLYCRILGDKTTYGILINTVNRHDDDFEFALGTDIEKAKESLNMILSFMADSPLGSSFSVTDEDNRQIQIDLPIKVQGISNKSRTYIYLQVLDGDEVIVGAVRLAKNNLKKALKLLDEKAERKVAEVLRKCK